MMNLWFVVAIVLLDATFAQSNGTLSGCEVCASTGDCSRAYRDEQGQFCGNWLDRQNDRRPCCCPDEAVCKVSNYACNCGYTPHYANNGGNSLVWLWSLLGSLGLLLCCCGCLMAAKRGRERDWNNEIPVAAPVASPGVSSQPYGANQGYGTHYGQNRGGMSAGTGAALGGTAGLIGGMMLGGALADHGDGGFDGGGGDFGGGDFGGDF